MHQSSTLYSGLDVHKESIAVAYVATEDHAEGISLGNIGTRQWDLEQLIRQLPSKRQPLVFVYAAGPCGYGLSRYLTNKGPVCWVVAPALIPKTPGDRGKTNRRDAINLARWRRAGDRPPGYVPQVEDDAIRALCRAREEVIRDLTTAKFRLKAFLLRHASRDTGQARWNPAPRRGRSEGLCPPPAQPLVCQEYVCALTDHPEGLARLAHDLTAHVQTWRRAPVVDALQARRGGPFTVAVPTVAARGALTRFDHPRPLMHSLGCTPSEYATGARRPQGGITQTGNRQARRALVEGAWASRYPAQVRRHLQLRLEKGAKPSHDSRGKAQIRLGQRYRHLSASGQNANQVVVASARELRAFMWAMAQEGPLAP